MSTLSLLVDGYLLGLSVTVLLVVYPAFRHVGAPQWARYHAQHSSRIALAVGPAWALEGILTLLWLIRGPHEGWAIIHAVAAVLTVLTTIAGAVPTHQLLSRSNENHDIHRLQRWHALRTLAWAVCVVASIYGR